MVHNEPTNFFNNGSMQVEDQTNETINEGYKGKQQCNAHGGWSSEQIEFAQMISAAGRCLAAAGSCEPTVSCSLVNTARSLTCWCTSEARAARFSASCSSCKDFEQQAMITHMYLHSSLIHAAGLLQVLPVQTSHNADGCKCG